MIRNLAQENIDLLQQGIDLAQEVNDTLYCTESELLPSSAGKHLRHIVDFYQAFFNGLKEKAEEKAEKAEKAEGAQNAQSHKQRAGFYNIDYDQRSRDPRLERERLYFCTHVRALQEKLAQLEPQKEANEGQNLNIHSCEGLSGNSSYAQSNLARELQFLLSHTVHHYALVAMTLRMQGFFVTQGFGVACSTRLHLQGLQEC